MGFMMRKLNINHDRRYALEKLRRGNHGACSGPPSPATVVKRDCNCHEGSLFISSHDDSVILVCGAQLRTGSIVSTKLGFCAMTLTGQTSSALLGHKQVTSNSLLTSLWACNVL